jgi:hypothetical protein
MKPTFKHRRPEDNMILTDNNCNTAFHIPVILSLSALRSNGERAGVRCIPKS